MIRKLSPEKQDSVGQNVNIDDVLQTYLRPEFQKLALENANVSSSLVISISNLTFLGTFTDTF